MECYFKSILKKRGYSQRIPRLWDEKGMVKVTEQRLANQACTILKSKWFRTVELEEIKRNKHRNCDEQSGATVVEEANNGYEHELPVENAKEMDSQTVQGARVQSERCDEAPRQMSEDQLVIWKRLNEIRQSRPSQSASCEGNCKVKDKRGAPGCRKSSGPSTNKRHLRNQQATVCHCCSSDRKTGYQTWQEESNQRTMVEKMATRTGGSAAKRPQPTRVCL